ncbi:Protein arginine N-methyltransferase 3 [Phlyctochytrium bullatum]|nr:Protein arginine N-methyltransferase 3 [Phlyctochytrium bullatum]
MPDALDLSFYEFIRVINAIRKFAQTKGFEFLKQEITQIRTDDSLLQPVVEEDPLLFGLDLEWDSEQQPSSDKNGSAEKEAGPDVSQLLEQNRDLGSAVNRLRELLQTQMNLDDGYFLLSTWDEPIRVPDDAVDGYFESYGEAEIHEIMLKDKVRTDTYRDFMYLNKDKFKDKIVLDVGCGTGILSMFAAKAGAKKVYAVDKSDFLERAKKVAEENNLQDSICFIKGAVEEIDLPVDKVDIIISEWMGYFLLFEGMLDSVLFARDRWLDVNGVMGPSTATMYLAAVESADWFEDRVDYWQDVYGFKMSTVRNLILKDGQVDVLDPENLMSEAAEIKVFDMSTMKVEDTDYESAFKLEIVRDGQFRGTCGWFDIFFPDGDNFTKGINFSTSPKATPTHWKQTVFALETGVSVKKGDVVSGTISVKKPKPGSRDLTVEISLKFPSGEERRNVYSLR